MNSSGRLPLKCGYFKNEPRERDCLCCREVDAMLIIMQCFGAAIILEYEGSISPSSFYGYLPDYQSHLLALYTGHMSSSFGSWCS